jgi:prepilin-type processing-associated H-X9-DG protein
VNYHNGSGPVTFADGHTDLPRWRSPATKFPQQSGVAAQKYGFLSVAADDPDLLWLRDHGTRPE